MNKMIELIKIGNHELGYLSFFETNKDVPFEIKRIYFTYEVPVHTIRGMHAHKKLQQLLWCPNGEIEVILDDGEKKETYLLNSPNNALLVGEGIWRDMVWKTKSAVLCVASSDYYNEEDYIRDYEVFLKYVREGYWKNENQLQSTR